MRHFFLAVVMVVMAALGARAFTVDGVTYSTSDGVATVTGASSKSITRLTIPATVTYGGTTYPVNFIAGNAFWGYSSLRELIIEDSDVYIGSTLLVNSDGHNQFGDPFNGCPIEKAYVGRNLANKLGSSNYQADITHITSSVPFDLTIAGKSTFILAGMTNGLTFRNSPVVTTLTVGGAVESIESNAFNGCTNLRKVTILPGETSIKFAENNIFTGCPIDSLIVGRDIPSSNNQCGGAKVKTLIITPEVGLLYGRIYGYDDAISKVVIEDGPNDLVMSMGPLDGCNIDSIYFGRNCIAEHRQILNGAKVRNVIFGPKITEIPAHCRSHSEVETVSILGAATVVHPEAFRNCRSLREVVFPSSLKEIGTSAFDGCSSLSKADIPEGVEAIRSHAFSDTKITELTVPASMNLLESAFHNSPLKKVWISDGDTDLTMRNGPFDGCELDSIYFGRNCIAERQQILYGSKVKNVVFGPKIIEIPAHCRSHSEVETVSILGAATVVHPEAFRNCRSLREIVFPSSLKEIGASAFGGCSSLSKADIPEGVEAIRSSAFSDTKITELTVPASMSILESAFYNSSLKKVWILDGDTDLTMSHGPFNGCELDSIYFGRNCIAAYQQILYGSKVKNVILGPKITEIPAHCEYHSEIETVSFSSNVTKIHPNAFANCKSLDSIFSKAKLPPVFAKLSNNFPSEIYETATLTVPVGSKKAYRAAEVWKLFRNIQSEGGGFKVSVSADTAYGEVLLNGSSASEITVDEDESLTVAISAVEGYSISNVTVNGTDVTASLVDGMLEYESLDSNMEIEVTFSIITFTLSVPAELTGGHILVNGLDAVPATVDYGSRLEISAVPDRGYLLASMTVGGVDVTALLDENRSYVIDRVTADVVVDAVFEPIVYTVTAVAPTDFGTLTLNGATGDCRVAFGQPLVIGVTPAHEGCYLASLTVDGTDVTASVKDGVYTVESVEADMTVEAVFGINTYTVELVCDPERGAIIPDLPGSDAGVTVTLGATLNLAITPAEGFEIESVLLDGTDVTSHLRGNSVLTLEYIKGPHRVEAVFAVRRVRLSVLGLEGGQLSMRYDYGSPVTMLVEPADGWMFHSLTLGDEVVTVLDDDDSYTIHGSFI